MPLTPDTLIQRNPSIVETTVGSEIVLMSLQSGYCYGLGETGSDVWRLLASPITLAALETGLREIYDAPEGELERDVDELLTQLLELDVVTLTQPNAA